MGYTETSGVGQKGWAIVELRAKAIPRNLSTLAMRCRAREVRDSSTDGPGCKRSTAKGGTETERVKRENPIQGAAAKGWILEVGRPCDGTEGDAPGAQVVVIVVDSVTCSRSTRVGLCSR